MARLKDRTNLPVKLASERALMHVLQIHKDANVVKEYCSKLAPDTARTIEDYSKRVLSKLNPSSESEDSEDTESVL